MKNKKLTILGLIYLFWCIGSPVQANSGVEQKVIHQKSNLPTHKGEASKLTQKTSVPHKIAPHHHTNKKNKTGVKTGTSVKPKLKTVPVTKNYSFSDIKHHETKKKLVVVEKATKKDFKPIKHNDSNFAKLDTSDFNESDFASIDFTADIKEADYYDKKTLEQVKNEIANTSKPYILYFGASWCIPCRLMRETVFKAHDVKKYLSDFYITYVDVDNFDGMDIKELYKVKNIPYMVIFDTNGKQIGRIEGSITSTSFSDKLKTYLLQ